MTNPSPGMKLPKVEIRISAEVILLGDPRHPSNPDHPQHSQWLEKIAKQKDLNSGKRIQDL